MTPLEERYTTMKELLVELGHKVSAASWIDEVTKRFYVCSQKTIPGTYGHPEVEITESWKAGVGFTK